jgi:hypothetical protein
MVDQVGLDNAQVTGNNWSGLGAKFRDHINAAKQQREPGVCTFDDPYGKQPSYDSKGSYVTASEPKTNAPVPKDTAGKHPNIKTEGGPKGECTKGKEGTGKCGPSLEAGAEVSGAVYKREGANGSVTLGEAKAGAKGSVSRDGVSGGVAISYSSYGSWGGFACSLSRQRQGTPNVAWSCQRAYSTTSRLVRL